MAVVNGSRVNVAAMRGTCSRQVWGRRPGRPGGCRPDSFAVGPL